MECVGIISGFTLDGHAVIPLRFVILASSSIRIQISITNCSLNNNNLQLCLGLCESKYKFELGFGGLDVYNNLLSSTSKLTSNTDYADF